MTAATGFVCVVFGLIVVIGQLISTINFNLAQKLGLQEKNDQTESLFRRLELNTARWDLVVLWTLPATGVLMIVGHPLWPATALVAGGIYVDTAGRELAKVLGLKRHGVKTGSREEASLYYCFLAALLLIGLWCIALGFGTLT